MNTEKQLQKLKLTIIPSVKHLAQKGVYKLTAFVHNFSYLLLRSVVSQYTQYDGTFGHICNSRFNKMIKLASTSDVYINPT